MQSLDDQRRSETWRDCTSRLVQFLDTRADVPLCLAVLKRLCRQFGEHGYPGFIKLLLIVSQSTHLRAQTRLADALALGLRRGDGPSGVLTTWGATRFWASCPSASEAFAAAEPAIIPKRQFDPIEYLSVWFGQRTHRSPLGEDAYRESLLGLLLLFDHSAEARQWYPLKIEADLAGVEGTFTQQTRQRLGALVEAWRQGQPAATIAAAATFRARLREVR
jgi:hypothetical protein